MQYLSKPIDFHLAALKRQYAQHVARKVVRKAQFVA